MLEFFHCKDNLITVQVHMNKIEPLNSPGSITDDLEDIPYQPPAMVIDIISKVLFLVRIYFLLNEHTVCNMRVKGLLVRMSELYLVTLAIYLEIISFE